MSIEMMANSNPHPEQHVIKFFYKKLHSLAGLIVANKKRAALLPNNLNKLYACKAGSNNFTLVNLKLGLFRLNLLLSKTAFIRNRKQTN